MTEAEALATIVTWSTDCPPWQRDALRRLVAVTPLEPAQIDELVSICKGETNAVPLTQAHVGDPARRGGAVHLRQINNVRDVNALAPDQRLTLHRSGLTIVYGDNGSGKSGYARILKEACRARLPNKPDAIIADIYEAAPGTPTATIEYTIGDQNYSCVWRHGDATDTALSSISVFDSRTANVHVDSINDLAYTPFPLKLLATLAQLCKSVRDQLAAEISQIKARTPNAISALTCAPTSAVGQLMARLSSKTPTASIETLAALSQDELDRLAQLTADLTGDPARAARQLSALKVKIEGYLARLDRLFAATGQATAERLREFAITREATRQAAEAASEALFRDEPLPHIGSDIWRALWESARVYSERDAYPDRAFPVVDAAGVCVLCQQDLDPAAADRLTRFEAFVRNDSQRRAEAARTDYENAREAFARDAISLAEARDMLATLRDELRQNAMTDDLRRRLVEAQWRHRHIARRHADLAIALPASVLSFDRQAILAQAADIEARAVALLAEAGSAARAALIAERIGLADRQWLAGIKADVLAEIARLGQIEALETAQRGTATNRITAKSTEIAQGLVTDALRAQFAREVASFEIAGLAVELRQENSTQGIPRFKVALTRKPAAAVGQVLSEGEHRCVALAAFMAELATAGNQSGIVFDDPVSSLDHMHREAVAKRLISEACRRQVVVFTHDLAFLFEMNRAADDHQPKPPIAISSISRGADKAGFCRVEAPFKARRVPEIMVSLARKLANERRHFEQGDLDKWRETVKSITSDLRDSWEMAVEETVGYVLRRLSNKVTTPGLVKMTAITVSDCEIMRDGFGRCSEMLHSAAAELNRPLPRPEALTAEIEALTAWATQVRQKQEAVKAV